jgi:molybdate transport system substrate-binding protein
VKLRTVAALVALVATILTACTSGAGAGSPAAPSAPGQSAAAATDPASIAPGDAASELTIFAAASLKNALEQARTAYEATNPGTMLTISTDSSSALEMQIEQGAPADVFLSADTTNPQKLVDGGFAAGQPVSFAGNELVIVVPANNPAGIESLADLAEDGVKVIAAGDEVPITKYTAQLIEKLAQQPDAPPYFAMRYSRNVVSKEDNVSGIVSKIELGEGDAGIVYVTDAAAAEGVTPVEIPEGSNVPATYAGVVLDASQNKQAASAFLDWLAGPEGQAVLAELGFLAPS